jgi:hypothetical protein
MNKIKLLIIVSALLSNCSSSRNKCVHKDFEELDLRVVRVIFKIPPYKIVDTTKYGPGTTILNYSIKSLDSKLDVVVFIDDLKEEYGQLDISNIAKVQKHEIESGQNDKKLLKEEYKKSDTLNVGYIKYLVEQPNEKFYASRIFFYKEKRLIVLWLFENISKENSKYSSLSDCILESIKEY